MLITIISLIPLLLGVILLFVALKKMGKGYEPKRALPKLIKKVLGENGTRIFAGLVGVSLIIFGFNFFMKVNHVDLSSTEKEKSDKVSITKVIVNGSDTVQSSIVSPLNMLEYAYSYPNKSFVSISFRNNQLKEIPEVVWDMINLKELNLTNNEITTIPVEKVKRLKKLQSIILINNPISESEIMKIKKELDVNIITE